jgi:glycosyltransferase involved in cell wall biosynthesis
VKILHCPTNVGNQPWVLSRSEREMGVKSNLVVNYKTWLNYPSDSCMGKYGDFSIYNIIKRTFNGFLAPFRYDIFHYYFGRSLLFWDDWPKLPGFPFLDLKIAKKLGKPIFMTLQGCDIRIAEKSNKNNKYTPCTSGACSAYADCIKTYDSQRIIFAKNILPLCDKVFYLNPELGHFVPNGIFLPYANVDLNEYKDFFYKKSVNKIPKIIHAPSNGAIKGTSFILEALNELKKSYEFELVLVEGLPHKKALEIYRTGDIAIDQVLAGWYGGIAVELMAMGIPVLSYIRESDLKYVTPRMIRELPILPIYLDSLVSDLSKILDQRSKWEQWGLESQLFVRRWHNPQVIAKAMIDLYKNPNASWDLEKYLIN